MSEPQPNIRKTVIGQKLLIFAIVLSLVLVSMSIAGVQPGILVLAFVAIKVFQMFAAGYLTKAMGNHIFVAIIIAFTMVVPYIALVILLVLNHRATKELRNAGLKVGLFGADLSKVPSGHTQTEYPAQPT